MIKIYTAGPYSDRELLQRWATRLTQQHENLVNNASWLGGSHRLGDGRVFAPWNREAVQGFAADDLDDICDSDIFVLHTAMPIHHPTNGRSVELGFALGIGVAYIIIVGYGEESIFHTLDTYTSVMDWTGSTIYHEPHLDRAAARVGNILEGVGE